jgi:tetratricopeptide (TPR) repeat protein
MSGKPRGHQKDLTQLRQELRAQGWTYVQIAGHIREIEHVSSRVAFRLTHGMTQQAVADRWNELFPSEDGTSMMTAKQISYWETWPQSGRKPDIEALNHLARIYCCQAADLLDGEDYRHLDEATRQEITRPTVDTVLDPTGSPILPGLSLFSALSGGSGGSRSGLDFTRAPEANILLSQVDLPDELAAALLHQLGTLVSSTASAGGSSARLRDVAFAQLVQILSSWAQTMDRREALRLLGWAATAATTAPLIGGSGGPDSERSGRLIKAIAAPDKVDETVIGHIEDVLWIAQRQDDTLGPHAALDTVLAQRNLVRLLLPECPAKLQPQLLAALSGASRLAGWLSFDLNDFENAEYYYEHARTTAHEAHNDELAAHVLVNMSHLATWTGKPRNGVDHAIAAQRWAMKTSNRSLQAYACDIAARAYAADGSYDDCIRELDQAHVLLARPSEESGRIRPFYDAGALASIRGACLLQLGHTRDAVQATETALLLLKPSHVRDIAITTIDLGLAYAKFGEIEHAADLVGDAGVLATRNSSARLTSQVRAARAELTQWQQTPAVRELDERLAACQIGQPSLNPPGQSGNA